MLENRVLRRIFEPKRDDVTGEWRKCTYPQILGTSNQGE
jgi:hypothetical protein